MIIIVIMKNFIIGSVHMVPMAQSAANWRKTHTHVDRTHSLTHLQHHRAEGLKPATKGRYFTV